MIKFSVFALIAAVIVAAPRASAQPRTYEEKRAAYREGFSAVRDRRWDDAYRIFLRLWSEEQTFDVAVNLGQAELQLGKFRDAAEHLAFGAKRIPLGESKELVERINKALQRAKEEVGSVTMIADRAGAHVRLDGNQVGTTPIDLELFVEPGMHTIEATLTGHAPLRQEFQASKGKQQSIVLKLDPVTSPAAHPAELPAAPSATRPVTEVPPAAEAGAPDYSPAIIAASVGGVALIGGVVSFVIGANKHADAEDRLNRLGGRNPCGPGVEAARDRECSEISDQAQAAKTFRGLGYVGVGAAVAAGAVSYVLWPRSRSAAVDAGIRPSVAVSRNGAFAALHGSF